MSRIVKSIPNTITSMNLLSGVIGVVFCFRGRMDIAFVLMLAASLFDFCDGLAARLLGAYSDIGKELDSLADEVSFGVLPSIMLFSTMCTAHGTRWFCFIPLLMVAFTALRLAKFNLDPRQHESFLGLPAPACAMICGSLCDICNACPDGVLGRLAASPWFLPLTAAATSALMVSEIPMFSMKFSKKSTDDFITTAKRTAFISISAMLVVVTAVTGAHWSAIVFAIFLAYLLMNIAFALIPQLRE